MVSAEIAAEGLALCSLSFGRDPISDWDTSTGCYYDTSVPVYRPPWCDWSGVNCNEVYSIGSVQVFWNSWDPNSDYWVQNSFKQSIPTTIAGLKGLVSLYVEGMGYTGPIPTALCSLTKLSSLYLDYNFLTGTIPTAIANLKQLNYLNLDGNRFNGTLPAALLNLPQLSSLSMQYNSLSGLPSAIHKNTVLNQLYLSGNQMIGTIPRGIGNLTNLYLLDLSTYGQQLCDYYISQSQEYLCPPPSGLNGTLPAELFTLKSLGTLQLTGNRLSGTISPSISRLTNLQSIQLSGNSLSGTIPSSISSLINLYTVYLDNNHFTGKIPNVFPNLNVYTTNGMWYTLLLHNNYFTGAIPPMSYSYVPFIYTFDLNCQLTSAFPAVILSSQTHCKPGTGGQLTPTAFPSPSPIPCTWSPAVFDNLLYKHFLTFVLFT